MERGGARAAGKISRYYVSVGGEHDQPHQAVPQHQHAASLSECRHVSVFVTFLSATGSCDDGGACELRRQLLQSRRSLRLDGQRPASVHCHHRLEGVRAGAKAELKEVLINNRHAGFELDLHQHQHRHQPEHEKKDQVNNKDRNQKNNQDQSQNKRNQDQSCRENQDQNQKNNQGQSEHESKDQNQRSNQDYRELIKKEKVQTNNKEPKQQQEQDLNKLQHEKENRVEANNNTKDKAEQQKNQQLSVQQDDIRGESTQSGQSPTPKTGDSSQPVTTSSNVIPGSISTNEVPTSVAEEEQKDATMNGEERPESGAIIDLRRTSMASSCCSGAGSAAECDMESVQLHLMKEHGQQLAAGLLAEVYEQLLFAADEQQQARATAAAAATDDVSGGQLAAAWRRFRQVFDDLGESAGFESKQPLPPRPPPPKLDDLRTIASSAGLPSPTELLVDLLQRTEDAEKEAADQNADADPHADAFPSGQPVTKERSKSSSSSTSSSTLDENKAEPLFEDEAPAKEAGQQQPIQENILEAGEEEEDEDPDIGVESFVSGEISRPYPESQGVQQALGILEEHLNDYRKLKQNGQAMLVFLHCLMARAEVGKRDSSLWPVYFDWLADDFASSAASSKPKHARRYAYEIYSTFLHEESPLPLTPLVDETGTDDHQRQLRDEALHPLERLFSIGASASADPAQTVRQAQPLLTRVQALLAPKLARLASGALADLHRKRRDGFLADLLPALPGGVSQEQRRLFAARCRPGLLARLRLLRQEDSAPSGAEASCLATLLVRSLDPELAESLPAAESPALFGCQHRSVGRQKSLLSRMGRAAASAASSSSSSSAGPDERLRVGAHALEPCALDKAQLCAACDRVLCGVAPQALQCSADCEQVVHRACAQLLGPSPCTKRAAARAKEASTGSIKASKSFGGSSSSSSGRWRLRHQQQSLRQTSTPPPATPRQRGGGFTASERIDEVEDWMLSGGGGCGGGSGGIVNPDPLLHGADDLPILKLTSSCSDQAVSQLAAEAFRAARLAPGLHHRANSVADSVAAADSQAESEQARPHPRHVAEAEAESGGGGGGGGGGFNKRASIGRSQSVRTPGSPRAPEFRLDKSETSAGADGSGLKLPDEDKLRGAQSEINISQHPESDDAASHPDIAGVPTDFDEYIVAQGINKQLCSVAPSDQPRSPDFDRYKDYQLALHELVFACSSHLRALTVLQLLFVRRWPRSCLPMLRQLGLHFVPECVALYCSLLASVGQPSQEEFRQCGRVSGLGRRLLDWYSDDRNVAEFRRLSLSFGFAKTASKQQQRRGASAAAGHEDDLIIRLDCLRRDCPELAQFFNRAESHELMRRRSFKDFYSVNMQHTMRMATLLDTAVRRAKKAKNACDFAESDAADLEKCLEKARSIIEYSNTIGVKLKELSRQLVLSRTFESFWERCRLDAALVERVQNQVSHLHTCQLHATREVVMRGFENSRLRLLVFTEFLLIISETEESKGVVKYQLLRHLGPSTSVGGQGGEAADKGNLRSVSCPPIIPMQNVVHTFEGRQTKSGASAEFRLVIDNPTIDARLAGGFRAEPMLVEFALSRDKPRHPFMDQEASISAHQLLDCIRQLLQPAKGSAKTPAASTTTQVHRSPTSPLLSGINSSSTGGVSGNGSRGKLPTPTSVGSGEREPSPPALSSVSSADAAFDSPVGAVDSSGAFDDEQLNFNQQLSEEKANGSDVSDDPQVETVEAATDAVAEAAAEAPTGAAESFIGDVAAES